MRDYALLLGRLRAGEPADELTAQEALILAQKAKQAAIPTEIERRTGSRWYSVVPTEITREDGRPA